MATPKVDTFNGQRLMFNLFQCVVVAMGPWGVRDTAPYNKETIVRRMFIYTKRIEHVA